MTGQDKMGRNAVRLDETRRDGKERGSARGRMGGIGHSLTRLTGKRQKGTGEDMIH